MPYGSRIIWLNPMADVAEWKSERKRKGILLSFIALVFVESWHLGSCIGNGTA